MLQIIQFASLDCSSCFVVSPTDLVAPAVYPLPFQWLTIFLIILSLWAAAVLLILK
jgi:hypothetical protein